MLSPHPRWPAVLISKYRHSTPADSRAASPHLRHRGGMTGSARGVIRAATRADGAGLERSTRADVALAWVRDYPGHEVPSSVPYFAPAEALLEYTEPLPGPIRQVLSEVAPVRHLCARSSLCVSAYRRVGPGANSSGPTVCSVMVENQSSTSMKSSSSSSSPSSSLSSSSSKSSSSSGHRISNGNSRPASERMSS